MCQKSRISSESDYQDLTCFVFVKTDGSMDSSRADKSPVCCAGAWLGAGNMLATACWLAPGYPLLRPRLISSLASRSRDTTSRYFSFRSSSSEVSSSWVSCTYQVASYVIFNFRYIESWLQIWVITVSPSCGVTFYNFTHSLTIEHSPLASLATEKLQDQQLQTWGCWLCLLGLSIL